MLCSHFYNSVFIKLCIYLWLNSINQFFSCLVFQVSCGSSFSTGSNVNCICNGHFSDSLSYDWLRSIDGKLCCFRNILLFFFTRLPNPTDSNVLFTLRSSSGIADSINALVINSCGFPNMLKPRLLALKRRFCNAPTPIVPPKFEPHDARLPAANIPVVSTKTVFHKYFCFCFSQIVFQTINQFKYLYCF